MSKKVRSNVIAPYAYTRLVSAVRPRDEAQAAQLAKMEQSVRSDQVAVLALALAVDALAVVACFWAAGRVYRVGMLLYGRLPSPRQIVAALRA